MQTLTIFGRSDDESVMRRLSAIVILFALVATSPASAADGWGIDPAKEHPPASSQNRIIRWCSADGKKERFASANLAVEGFQPCGELNTPVACDPVGQRMIGKSEKPPIYKDCSVGPRIVVHKADGIKIGSAALAGEPLGPLSPDEQAALKRDVKSAEKDQSTDTQMQLEKMVDGILQSMLVADAKGSGARGAAGSKGGYGFSDDEIDDMVRYVDPKFQDHLRRVLKRR